MPNFTHQSDTPSSTTVHSRAISKITKTVQGKYHNPTSPADPPSNPSTPYLTPRTYIDGKYILKAPAVLSSSALRLSAANCEASKPRLVTSHGICSPSRTTRSCSSVLLRFAPRQAGPWIHLRLPIHLLTFTFRLHLQTSTHIVVFSVIVTVGRAHRSNRFFHPSTLPCL